MKDNNPSVAMTALLFGAIGFIAGVLMAPKSGREMRSDIGRKAHGYKERAVSTGRDLKDNLSETAHDLKDTAGRTIERTKSVASDATDETKGTLRRAKSKADNDLSS